MIRASSHSKVDQAKPGVLPESSLDAADAALAGPSGLRKAATSTKEASPLPFGLSESYFEKCSPGDRALVVSVLPAMIRVIESKGVKVHLDLEQFQRPLYPGFVVGASYQIERDKLIFAPFAISTRKTFEPSNRNTGNFHMNVSLAYGRKLAPEGLEALRLGGNGKAVKDFTPSDCLGISNSGLIEYRTVEQLLESVGRTGNDYYKNLTHNVLDKVKSERKSRFVSRHDNLVKKVTASPRYAAMLGWQRREVDLTVSLAPEEVPFAVNRRMGIGMTFPAKAVLVAHPEFNGPHLDRDLDPLTKDCFKVVESSDLYFNGASWAEYGRLPNGSLRGFLENSKNKHRLVSRDPMERALQAADLLRGDLVTSIKTGAYASHPVLLRAVYAAARVPVLEKLLAADHPGATLKAVSGNDRLVVATVGKEDVQIWLLGSRPNLREQSNYYNLTIPTNGKVGVYAVVFHGKGTDSPALGEQPFILPLGGPEGELGQAEELFVEAISNVLRERAQADAAHEEMLARQREVNQRTASAEAAKNDAFARIKAEVEVHFHGETESGVAVTVVPMGSLGDLKAEVTMEKAGRKITFRMKGDLADGEIKKLAYSGEVALSGLSDDAVEMALRMVVNPDGWGRA